MNRGPRPWTTVRRGVARRFFALGTLAAALPGCPLSDNYFVDPRAGAPGVGGIGAAGLGGSGGAGGIGAETGGTGGTGETGGTAGTAAAGGETEAGAGGMPPDCDPAPERCDGLSNDCDDEIDEGADCPSGCSAKVHDGHSYLLCLRGGRDGVDYQEASDRCWEADDGLDFRFFLVRIDSAEENSFIKDWLAELGAPEGSIWTGGNDIGSGGIWTWGQGTNAVQFFVGADEGGGSPYMGRFNDFAPGQPNGANGTNEDCAVMSSDVDWQWIDVGCSEAGVGFVCEQEP
jgi:hypothetical protein